MGSRAAFVECAPAQLPVDEVAGVVRIAGSRAPRHAKGPALSGEAFGATSGSTLSRAWAQWQTLNDSKWK